MNHFVVTKAPTHRAVTIGKHTRKHTAAGTAVFCLLFGLLASAGTALAQPCTATPDINGDGSVNSCDMILLATDINTTSERSDFNCDGQVNLTDVSTFYLAQCYLGANPPPPPPASMGPATIGVYADAAGTITTWDVPLPSVVHYYVVAHGVPVGIDRFLFSLDIPAGLTVPSSMGWPAGFSSTNPGLAGTNNYLVWSADSCLPPGNGTVLLAHFTEVYYVEGQDLTITVSGPDMTGAECMAPSEHPSYGACGSGCDWTYFDTEPKTTCAGRIFRDYDGDCIQDPGEPGLGGRTVILEPGARAATTDAGGWYYFLLSAPGPYTVQALPFPGAIVVCPASTIQAFDAAPFESVNGLDFAAIVNPGVHDLAVQVAGGRARRGRDIVYAVSPRNWGAEVESPCTVTFTPPPETEFVACSDDGFYDAQANLVTWTESLNPGATPTRTVRLFIPIALPVGTPLVAYAAIGSASIDDHPEDNVHQSEIEITGPYDPNEKRAVPLVDLAPDGLVFYQVHFQNVGNDTAFTVVVRDTLSADLDIATVVDGTASHAYFLTRTDRELKWTFPDIALPDSTADQAGSNGFFTFTVRPVSGLPNSTVLTNRAAIYFDYNDPVITNFASTTFIADPSGVAIPGANDAGDFHLESAPNPFNPLTMITFSLPESARASLRIYDVSGRLVRALLDEARPAGNSEVGWNGADDTGRAVASGTYFARLSVDGRHSVRSLALVR